MGEDPADGAEIGDEGQESAGLATGITEQHVDEEHAAEQVCARGAPSHCSETFSFHAESSPSRPIVIN